jgi:hypothetical protein
MRRGLLVDAQGNIHAAPTPHCVEGLVYVGLAQRGAELAFHRGRVGLPALSVAMRLLTSCKPRRVALRLLPEDGVAMRIFGLTELAHHVEFLARPAPAAQRRPAKSRALASRYRPL